MSRLLTHHLEDLQRAGLSDETIEMLGFYSGTAVEVQAILGFDAGPGLVIPYPPAGLSEPFSRIKPDTPPVINGRPAKYLSPRAVPLRAYIPPQTWEAPRIPKQPLLSQRVRRRQAVSLFHDGIRQKLVRNLCSSDW